MSLKRPEQFAEMVADVIALREKAGTDVGEPYDFVAEVPPGTDPADDHRLVGAQLRKAVGHAAPMAGREDQDTWESKPNDLRGFDPTNRPHVVDPK
jgi:hypothetical protein